MGDWVSEGELGGYYWKVVRWAYEKQGLFQPPGAPVPVTTVGVLPPIDVYIDDGKGTANTNTGRPTSFPGCSVSGRRPRSGTDCSQMDRHSTRRQ